MPDGVEVHYVPYKDYEPDNVKIFHDFDRVSDGKFHRHLDWSPYSTPSENDLEMWFALGCPDRWSIGDGKGSSAGKSMEFIPKKEKQNNLTTPSLIVPIYTIIP